MSFLYSLRQPGIVIDGYARLEIARLRKPLDGRIDPQSGGFYETVETWRHHISAPRSCGRNTEIGFEKLGVARTLLADKYEVGWHVDMQERISKRHFLGYAARYIRRPPIAQHRFQEVDGAKVKFLTKDTATKETVLEELTTNQ